MGWRYQEWLIVPDQEEAVCCWLREKGEKQEQLPTVSLLVEIQHQSWYWLKFLALYGLAWLIMFLDSPRESQTQFQVA